MSNFCKFRVYEEKTVVEGGERAAYYGILDSIEDGGVQLSYANTDELAHTHTLIHSRGLILPSDYLQHAAGMPIVCLRTRVRARHPTDV